MIILYFETCYVASIVSPGGVVVITPDLRPGDVGSSPIRGIHPIFSEEYVESIKRCPYTYMFDSFHCHICVSSLYENPDGFLGRYAYSNEEKIGFQGSSTVIILYFETCYVASMVNPGGVVIKPD